MSAKGRSSPHLHLRPSPIRLTALASRSNDAMGSRGNFFFVACHPRTSTRTSTLRQKPVSPTPSSLLATDNACGVHRQSVFSQTSKAPNHLPFEETFEPQPNDRRR